MDTLRERFIQKAAGQKKTVTPAFLGEPVDIVGLTLAERRDLLKSCLVDGETDVALLQVRVIIETARDPQTHTPVFTPGDQAMLLDLPAASFDELASVALSMNGLQLVFAKAFAEKEEAEKN